MKSGGDRWAAYRKKSHKFYLDEYAAYIKARLDCCDYYANVDVPGNAELTWRNQLYLEDKHGLKPVPVVHKGQDLSWIDRYRERGHDFIGIGALVRGFGLKKQVNTWLDCVFEHVGDRHGMPQVKLHGFGVTKNVMMFRYPWFSVDSTGWCKLGHFGRIALPYKKNGEWDFYSSYCMYPVGREYQVVRAARSFDNVRQVLLNDGPMHALSIRWADYIGVPYGVIENGVIVEPGICNCVPWRTVANIRYYEKMVALIPEWPWPFHRTSSRGFDYQ